MKNIISYFIKFPVAVNIFMLGFLIFGVIGYLSLNSSFFPLSESKIITIAIAYPGASPQEIEEGVVLQIEDNLKGIVGVDRITSVSNENSGVITVETVKGADVDVVLTDVKNAVDRVPSFPTGMEPLVVAKKENVRETIQFSVNGENIPLKNLKIIAREVENDLRAIDGISQITISGYPEEEIEIAINNDALLAYNLSFQEVADAVASENILTTGGNIKTSYEEYLIRANNRNYYADELDFIAIRTNPDGTTVYLKDVAVVKDQFEDVPSISYFNGNLSVNIAIENTNSEDLISSAKKVQTYMDQYNRTHDNVTLSLVNDNSKTIVQRTQLLLKNASVGILLVVFFLSVFLNTRLAFWVAIGLPISFLGMFALAGQFGVTINVLSLFGMIIVIGILVDDGIVIAENIYHHYEKGKSPIRAAIDGTVEVIPPIISAILTTIIAFSTFFFLDGRIGEFFGEVSIIVILTLLISLIEAMIILPAHIASSNALKKSENKKQSGFFAMLRNVNVVGDKIMSFLREKLYSPFLRFSLNNKFFSFSIFLALLIITIGAIKGGVIRATIFPPIASDRVSITLAMPEGTNVEITDSIISMVEKHVWEVNEEYTEKQTGNLPVVQNVIKNIGPGAANASIDINLLPGEERDFASFEIANAVKEKVGKVYGVESLIFGANSNFGGSPVAVSLLGNNIEDLKAAKEELKSVLETNPELKDISDNNPLGIKEIKISLKPNAYLLGFNTNSVMQQVRAGFFGFLAQRFQRGQDEIKVWVRYDESYRSSIKNLEEMRIIAPDGSKVPLQEIATYEIERGEIAINHLNGMREIQVTADIVNPEVSAPVILEDIETRIMPDIQSRYPSVTAIFEGQNREGLKFINSAKVVFPIIILLIYITIAFTFRSYSQPLLLLLLVPFSMIAVAWGHVIHGFPLNLLSILGIIALIGIMVNDGLVLISKFNTNLKEGMPFDQALLEAGNSRFRAIFLTSITTIAGLAPLIFEKSRQAQFLIPMAISIAYGIAIATLLTLIVLPILLAFVNSVKVNSKWLFTGKRVAKEEVERAVKEIKYEEENE